MPHRFPFLLFLIFLFFFLLLCPLGSSHPVCLPGLPAPQEQCSLTDPPAAEWDPNGYLFFCLCMGRFGNQIEQLLGSLVFAREVNRTAVLPPFIMYYDGSKTEYELVNFSRFFDVERVNLFHRAISILDFNRAFGECWPPGETRSPQCFAENPKVDPCAGKSEGECKYWHFNPSMEGVDKFQLEPETLAEWIHNFPPSKYPLVHLNQAPGHFPVYAEHRIMQVFLQWDPSITDQANAFIKNHLVRPYIGIHMRNGVDWEEACSVIQEPVQRIMASPQCFYDGFLVSREICFPPDNFVLYQTLSEVIRLNASSVFISTDNRSMKEELRTLFKSVNRKVKLVEGTKEVPLDLVIHSRADYFIGNCASTFTSFIKRDRDIHGRPSGFWGLVTKE